ENVPEVNGDESALVPPQAAPKAEWPKKIRTLTAAELDRLTIDAEGRFLWDGKPVTYEVPSLPVTKAAEAKMPEFKTTEAPAVQADAKPVDPFDRIALEIMESTRLELADGRPAPARAAEPLKPAEEISLAEALNLVAEAKPAEPPMTSVAVTRRTGADRIRVSLSGWQSLGLIVVLLALLLGAAGIGALGWVAAHDWSCRTGLTTTSCPKPPPAPPQRAEIPA
ncbi:unnamed protein product, partial [Phaeothamnion confervicola]